MLSSNVADARINYGFITESSSHFNYDVFVNNPNYPFVIIADPNDPNIVIDNDGDDDDDEGMMCFATSRVRGFKSGPRMQAWVDKHNGKNGWSAKFLVTCGDRYYAIKYKC